MTSSPPTRPGTPPAPLQSPQKSHLGVGRLWRAARYSLAGLRAAWRHEAPFRLELTVGIPLLVLACLIAPGRLQALLLCASIVLVWIVELMNSALEAVADSVTIEEHPLIRRAKDMGSAAVLLSVAGAGATWIVVLWP